MGICDRACQREPGLHGAGAVPYIDNSQYYIIIFTAGHGTNNQAVFSALWLLLKTALDKGIKHLQVMGDSKLTIVWANSIPI